MERDDYRDESGLIYVAADIVRGMVFGAVAGIVLIGLAWWIA